MPYFIDSSGKHLGFFLGSAPANGIEVPVPNSVRSVWNGAGWEDPEEEPVSISLPTIILRLLMNVDMANIKTAFDLALMEMSVEEREYVQGRLASMSVNISSADPIFRQLITRLGANPDIILAP